MGDTCGVFKGFSVRVTIRGEIRELDSSIRSFDVDIESSISLRHIEIFVSSSVNNL
jgi:hypothetical protein